MNIYLQSDMSFGDNQALRVFFGDHGQAHATYARLLSEMGLPTSGYFDVSDQGTVDAWTAMNDALRTEEKVKQPNSITNWLIMHATLHDAESQALGITLTSGLDDADFTNKEQFFDWFYIHQQQHLAQDMALGL